MHVSQISEKQHQEPGCGAEGRRHRKGKGYRYQDGKLSLSMKALNETAAEDLPEEKIEIPKAEELTTTLGDLFKNIKL